MRRAMLSLCLVTASLARSAQASTSVTLPAGGGLPGLAVTVDVAGKALRFATCHGSPCVVPPEGPAVAISAGDAPLDAGQVTVDDVPLAGGRHLAHVRVALGPPGPESAAWEALLVAGAPPLFAGMTGWTRGEPGERSGMSVRFLDADGDKGPKIVVVGDIREELRVCGDDATLLDPRGLDPSTLLFHGATLQRLSAARRGAATSLEATPRRGHQETPLAPLLVATEASSAIGPAAALTDGDLGTAWSEARPGRGQGEFVSIQSPFDVPITRFAITVSPVGSKARPEGAAPETVYLATSSTTYEVTLPEDAWSHPGDAYEVLLPAPLQTSCVTLVLGDAFTRGRPHPEVTVAELTAYSAFDRPGATLAQVAAVLTGGDAKAAAAAGLLERAGSPGIEAATLAFPSLDAVGRALALNVVASAPTCAASGPLLASALADADEVVRAKALAKLHEPGCGREAFPALLVALASDPLRAKVAPLVALLGRERGLPPLANELGKGSPEERQALRAATANAARDATAEQLVPLLEASLSRSEDAALDLLRALRDRLVDARSAAARLTFSLLARKPVLAVRYRLVDVVATLATAGDPTAQATLANLILHDPAPEVRARAAELVAGAASAETVAAEALADAAPRVREGTLRGAAENHLRAVGPRATVLLATDPWTFVRIAAAEALGALGPTPMADRALADALGQLAPRVREQAALALGAHGAAADPTGGVPLLRRLRDPKEDVAVRTASARALGMLCDGASLGDLTALAIAGGSSPDAADVVLGLAATDALGLLHPKDLDVRFAPLRAKSVRPDARAAAARAVSTEGRCRLP